MALPLAEYFVSPGYLEGQPFAGEEHGYSQDINQDVEVWEHRKTGIRVWSCALDLRTRRGGRVLFHYTNAFDFRLITNRSNEKIRLLASLTTDRDSNFGCGLYASSKAPDQWSCKQEACVR